MAPNTQNSSREDTADPRDGEHVGLQIGHMPVHVELKLDKSGGQAQLVQKTFCPNKSKPERELEVVVLPPQYCSYPTIRGALMLV